MMNPRRMAGVRTTITRGEAIARTLRGEMALTYAHEFSENGVLVAIRPVAHQVRIEDYDLLRATLPLEKSLAFENAVNAEARRPGATDESWRALRTSLALGLWSAHIATHAPHLMDEAIATMGDEPQAGRRAA